MKPQAAPGNGVCYLDGRTSVVETLEPHSMIDSPPALTDTHESRWLVWARSLVAVLVVLVLVILGFANIATYSRWHEVEDGVLWAPRAEGLTAAEVVPGSAADAAGIRPGDLLVAV